MTPDEARLELLPVPGSPVFSNMMLNACSGTALPSENTCDGRSHATCDGPANGCGFDLGAGF
jgi:hypothetical protein